MSLGFNFLSPYVSRLLPSTPFISFKFILLVTLHRNVNEIVFILEYLKNVDRIFYAAFESAKIAI